MRRLAILALTLALPASVGAHPSVHVRSYADMPYLHSGPRYIEAVRLRQHLRSLYHQVAAERWRVHHHGTPARRRPLSWRLPRLRRAEAWRLGQLAALRERPAWRPHRPRIPHLAAWLCIHAGEGAWNSETGNGYHGGLQMDSSFEAAYGAAALARWGHASAWPPLEQMAAAERAWQTRGFTPWPNTARACGLL